MINGDYVEVRLPWQLLNFSNPSEMQVHDDYYECYGVENLSIDEIYIGVGASDSGEKRISMKAVELEGWGEKVTYHERLKKSYYALQELWTKETDDTTEGGDANVGK